MFEQKPPPSKTGGPTNNSTPEQLFEQHPIARAMRRAQSAYNRANPPAYYTRTLITLKITSTGELLGSISHHCGFCMQTVPVSQRIFSLTVKDSRGFTAIRARAVEHAPATAPLTERGGPEKVVPEGGAPVPLELAQISAVYPKVRLAGGVWHCAYSRLNCVPKHVSP